MNLVFHVMINVGTHTFDNESEDFYFFEINIDTSSYYVSSAAFNVIERV